MLAYNFLNFSFSTCGGFDRPTTSNSESDPRQTALMVILVFWIVCKALKAFEAANHNPCISLSCMKASVWLILVLSTSFYMVFIRLVLHLSDLVSQDTRQILNMKKFSDPSANPIMQFFILATGVLGRRAYRGMVNFCVSKNNWLSFFRMGKWNSGTFCVIARSFGLLVRILLFQSLATL